RHHHRDQTHKCPRSLPNEKVELAPIILLSENRRRAIYHHRAEKGYTKHNGEHDLIDRQLAAGLRARVCSLTQSQLGFAFPPWYRHSVVDRHFLTDAARGRAISLFLRDTA